ncbi:MAG: Substrate-specific component BioY of biotin transporter [Oscillospiraceae bacterium]|nr:Substrate-specific component BioY of biotin transporter [Oscillospiraceae bacterium]
MRLHTRDLVFAALFAALTAVGAFLQIPVGTVPITLQFLFTALAGVLLGARYGALSQAVYILLGLAGIPLFTHGGGLGYVFQPTFGFLLGLIPAAWLIGKLTQGNCGLVRSALACVAGDAVLYLIGTPYVYLIMKFYMAKEVSFWVVAKGMLVFLPGDALKIAVTVFLMKPLRRALRRPVGQRASNHSEGN